MGRRLALVLPGSGYTSLGAAIRFPVMTLDQAGFEARDIAYPEVDAAADEFPWDDFSAATVARIQKVLSEHEWTETVVVAKSLGTGVLARAGAAMDLPRPRAIWLTPTFGSERVRRDAIELGWPSLVVAGSADPYHDQLGFDLVVEGLSAQRLLIDGADHSLQIPGDARASVAAMAQLVDAVSAFAPRPSPDVEPAPAAARHPMSASA